MALGLASLVLVTIALQAEPASLFLDKTIQDDEGEHRYVIFVPEGYTPDRTWPVILFLHGSGERGKDNRKQISKGLAPAVRKNPERFPAIVLFPQAESGLLVPINVWAPDAPDGKRALAILDQTQENYTIDPDRVYLTGMSMGGFGTYLNGMADPDRWAALVPICGGGNLGKAKTIAHLPIWCFHGGADLTVPVTSSRLMIDKLKKAGGSPKYTEYPGVGHDSWSRAYAEPELWQWVFSQQRAKK